MKIRLAYKIFGAFIFTAVVIIALTIGALRFLVYHGFADYVNRVDAEKLTGLVVSLGVEYKKDQDWSRLISSPKKWREIVMANLVPQGFDEPADDTPPPSGSLKEPSPQNRDAHHLARRLFLLDRDKNLVAGRSGSSSDQTLLEITNGYETVGWLGIRKIEPPNTELEADFLKRQYKWFYLLGACVFLLTGAVTLILSRNLLLPVKKLTDGAQALALRDFQARVDIKSQDELGLLAADFNLMAQTLERYETMRQQWMSDISHELRTPLAILRGEIEARQDGVRETDREFLNSIHAEVVHVSKIVDDLHKLSLADAQSLVFKKEPANPVRILKETLGAFQTLLSQRKIDVALDFPDEGDIPVAGDADRLKEVFSNLFENVLRYSDSPGALKITLEYTDKLLVIYFEDSGPGVPPESLERLFDRLYRVDKSRSRSLGGSGLGLSICKNIIEAHGGEIIAENGSSGGLRIRITLPLIAG